MIASDLLPAEPVSPEFQKRVADLAFRFQRQTEFAQGYSPLYARLFELFAGWLTASGYAEDPLVQWLVTAGNGRTAFSLTLLLPAGLHRLVLSGADSAAGLSRYCATVGGNLDFGDAAFSTQVRATILQNQPELAQFMQTAAVQTNETGRGLAWLLPIQYCPWESIQLVDLGASAGLNLLADFRAYRLQDTDGRFLLNLGAGTPPQFITPSRGTLAGLAAPGATPRIIRRLGCDIMPFQLKTRQDELTLMSFIWADQPQRLQRLREGIAAFRLAEQSPTPVQLTPVVLPDELGGFLQTIVSRVPVVLYNTYMTNYLEEKGAALRQIIGDWAAQQDQPVLWLQWEPAYGSSETPEYGWCAWTADLWQAGGHTHWQLGWIHPHGVSAQFEPGLLDWIAHWS